MVMNDEVPGSRTRLRQVALLALMALAGSLIFVLPEPEDDSFALSSQESTIQIGPETGPGAQRFSGSDTGEEGDELALAPDTGEANASPRFVEPEPDGVAFEALSAGAVATTAPPSAPEVEEPSTTTEAPTTTATDPAPAETTAEEQPTTTAGSNGESSDDVADPASDTEATDSTADDPASGDAASGDTATAEADASAESDETTQDTAADTTVPADSPTTEPPATDPPETTPPETAPPETTPPADPAFVDTGNGVMVPPVLLAIRFCESTDNYGAANPRSSARGGYQFLTGSWAAYGHKDRYGVNQAHLATPAQQDEAALITWQRDGTRPWNASKSCWSKRI